jgi:hypothetical protein
MATQEIANFPLSCKPSFNRLGYIEPPRVAAQPDNRAAAPARMTGTVLRALCLEVER